MKRALTIIGIVLVVLVAFVSAYYFGYYVTEPKTEVAPPDETGPKTEVAPPDETGPNTEVIPPDETVEVNELETVVFTEEEINSLLSQVVTLVAESGLPVKLDYARARLAEDKMFLSISAEAMDIKLESEDVEVSFQGTEMSVSGKVPLGGLDADFSVRARIAITDGELTVSIEDIKPAAISFMLLYSRGINREELNQYLNQQLAQLPFSLPLQELEEITIEGGKLIVKGR